MTHLFLPFFIYYLFLPFFINQFRLENLKLIEIWPRQFFKLETVLELVVLLVLLVLSGELRVSDEGPNWRLLHLTKHFSVNLTCQ